MKLSIATPLAIVTDTDDVVHLRAEDDSGAFGILAGHADFVTALAVSVVTWRDKKRIEHHVATRGGMLQVRDGSAILIATSEAVAGDDLRRLEADVLSVFRRRLDEEKAARVDAERLYLLALRQILVYLRSERAALPGIPDVGKGHAQ